MIQHFRALSFNLNSYLQLEIPPHNSLTDLFTIQAMTS
jgi:hypothetical protein